MSKKDMFINMVDVLLSDLEESKRDGFKDAIEYFEVIKTASVDTEKPKFTENGILILRTMQETQEERANLFTAKQIAESAEISSRGVSGATRKLVTDGYVEIISKSPNVYSLTDAGKSESLSQEDA